MLKSIQEAFSDENFVFLILPDENKEKSKKILKKRMERRNYTANRNRKLPFISKLTKRLKVNPDELQINNEFIDSKSNFSIASHIVYTHNASPDEISEAIIAIYNGRPLSQGKVRIIKNPNKVKSNNFIQKIPYQTLLSQSKETPLVSEKNSNETEKALE